MAAKLKKRALAEFSHVIQVHLTVVENKIDSVTSLIAGDLNIYNNLLPSSFPMPHFGLEAYRTGLKVKPVNILSIFLKTPVKT